MIITKSVAILIILAFMGTPAATATANSSFYDQIFSATSSQEFEDAVNNFFEESLSDIQIVNNGFALFPLIDPTELLELRSGENIQVTVSTFEKINAIEVFFQLGSSSSSIFRVAIIQSSVTIFSQDITVSVTGWKTIELTDLQISGTFDVFIMAISDVGGNGVKVLSQSEYNMTAGSIDEEATYDYYYEETITITSRKRVFECGASGCGWVWKTVTTIYTQNVWDTLQVTTLPAIKLQKTTLQGWEYRLVDTGSALYRVERVEVYPGGETPETKGYVSYPYLVAYYPHIDGGVNYDLPIDFRLFLEVMINLENGYYSNIDEEAFYDAVVNVARDPVGASADDWLIAQRDSPEAFQRLTNEP
ncbi:MAG: hypothetical protein ACW99Q_12800 [Candidatus Kariarchaeaceae archaeon]|jgi:hypothetical protein